MGKRKKQARFVHRRTGGLENYHAFHSHHSSVHRRTGGLEKVQNIIENCDTVHRRTGGLEITHLNL